MDLKQVKSYINKAVYFDTGQLDINGSSIKEYLLTGCILRKHRSNGRFYYQAELRESAKKRAVTVVDLAKVLTPDEV